MKRLVDYDPMTGTTTWFDYLPESDMTIVAREQDTQGFLDLAKALRNDTDRSKKGIKNNWWHYSIIPNIIAEKWLNEDGIDIYKKDHEERWLKKINSPEYKYLKVTDKVHL